MNTCILSFNVIADSMNIVISSNKLTMNIANKFHKCNECLQVVQMTSLFTAVTPDPVLD